MTFISSIIHIFFIAGLLYFSDRSVKKKDIISYTMVNLVNIQEDEPAPSAEKVTNETAIVKEEIKKEEVKKAIPTKDTVEVRKETKDKGKEKKEKEKEKEKKEDEMLSRLQEIEKRWSKEERTIQEKQKGTEESKRLEEQRFAERIAQFQKKWGDSDKVKKDSSKRITISDNDNTINVNAGVIPSDYIKVIVDTLNNNWDTPEKKPDYTGIKAVVISFRIYNSGDILGVTVEESSGIAALDSAAKEAVVSTAKLPPFPSDIKDTSIGVHFKFEYTYF